MTGISIVCLATLRIISVLGENSYNGVNCLSIEESRYGELQCKNISSLYIKPFWFDEQQKCEYHISSTNLNGRLPVECHGFFTCNANHYRSYRSKRYQNSNRGVNCNDCFPLYSGDIARIKCQASSAANIDIIPYDNEICEASMLSKNHQLSGKKICESSFTCSIENTGKTESIYVNCTVGNSIPGDDTTMEYHIRIPVDDRSTKSHVGKPVDDRSTESHGGYNIPDDNASKKTIAGYTASDDRPGHSSEIDRIATSNDVCIKITAGGAVSFATIIVLLLFIIYIQRRKLINASFTSLTPRRDQNYYNEIAHQMSDSITGQYYDMSPLSAASGGQSTVQQRIDQIQHIDTSDYLIPSSISQMSAGHYESIDN